MIDYLKLSGMYFKGRLSPTEAADTVDRLKRDLKGLTATEVEDGMRFLAEERDCEWNPTLPQMKSAIIAVRIRKNPNSDGAKMGEEQCDYCADGGWIRYLKGLPEGKFVEGEFAGKAYTSYRYPDWPVEDTLTCPCPRCMNGEYMMQNKRECQGWDKYGRGHMEKVASWLRKQPEDSKFSVEHNAMNRPENARRAAVVPLKGVIPTPQVSTADQIAPIDPEGNSGEMAFLDDI